MGLPRALTLAAVARTRPRAQRRRDRAVAVAAALAFLGINVAIFLAPIDYHAFGSFAYAGVFMLLLLATAALVVPIPYVPVLVHVMGTADSAALVVLAATLGSALGESTGWLIGRAERALFSDHPFVRRLEPIAKSPWKSGLVVFAFAAPPNPVFDMAGLAAGALGMPYRAFFIAVFAGRLVRFAALAVGLRLLGL